MSLPCKKVVDRAISFANTNYVVIYGLFTVHSYVSITALCRPTELSEMQSSATCVVGTLT